MNERTLETATPAATVAVVCEPRDAATPELDAFLQRHDLTAARRYAPRDINEVERVIAAGAVRRVVFADPVCFLELLWSEELDPASWRSSNVQVEFALAPITGATGDWAAMLLDAWLRYRRRQRTARVVAGAVLSVAAIVAAFVLLLLAGDR